MDKEYKLDKLQEEIDDLSNNILEDRQEIINLETNIEKLKYYLNILDREKEIKIEAAKHALLEILKIVALGTIFVLIIALILSSNLFLTEGLLLITGFIKGILEYNKRTKELNKLLSSTNFQKINKIIKDKESSLYETNIRLKLNEKSINLKEQEVRLLLGQPFQTEDNNFMSLKCASRILKKENK